MTRSGLAVVVVLLASQAAGAHVGSPDVFVEAEAGPYRAFITVRPPSVIPGVAEVEVLVPGAAIDAVRIVPTPLTGTAARFAPTPDDATPAADDPRRFTGHLWMMTAGAWQVRVTITGDRGAGTTAVPVPTLPRATTEMGRGLGVLLFSLMLLLVAGAVSIVSAMSREASLGAGETADPRRRRRGRVAAAIATVAITGILCLGHWWWTVEASTYALWVYKPLTATPSIASNRLTLAVTDPGWISVRRIDDFVPDHGRLMHFFLVSPDLGHFWHLHPAQIRTGTFEQHLPNLPAGRYDFFADVVHATGLPETMTGRLDVSAIAGAPLVGDDGGWTGSADSVGSATRAAVLSDGTRMTWVPNGQAIQPKRLTLFTFRVEDASGRSLNDLELYMGMPGHAVFIRRDREVFAHVHPSGSAPMAALEISTRSLPAEAQAATSSHDHAPEGVPGTVSFPYGVPAAGDYRIFVQIKRQGRIHTGVFELPVQ